MQQQTTNEKGRPAGNEATQTQTDGDCVPASVARQQPTPILADSPCMCGVNAAGQCQTCRGWLVAFRTIRGRLAGGKA